MQNYKMWIEGKWVDASSGKMIDVINPATEEVVARIPRGDKTEVDMAVKTARKAFPIWLKKPQMERIAMANKIADAILKNAAELGKLDVIDHGTPARMAGFMAFGAAG
jgi:acyl-CoA reductase-like NAD-dependent aldehyde dehydrogenase